MSGFNGRNPLQMVRVMPEVTTALTRHPEYADAFPIGASLYDWAVMGA
ncbi:hypothetical protein [Nocardioides marmoriginsengisoli]|nr:hypothetical protein [Nocardioides marmoriginsengisoli]